MLRYILLICVLQGIADSAVAQSKTKDPMSWKDILDRAGPPATIETPAPAIVLPTLTGRVVDEANLIDNATRLVLTSKLTYLENKTSDQLVVVTLNSLQGTSIEDFGLRLGRYWQIGQKNKNNGVLLIVAPNQHKVRIEVGYGLESTLTNGIAKRIIDNTIIPRFQTSDFVGGVSNGVDAIINVLINNSLDANISSVGQNHGPSFDCDAAKNANEKLICQSTELSELDQKINAVYDDVTNLLNNRDRKELQQHQNEWVRERNDCGGDFLCTKFAYTKRIDRLNSLLLKLREAGVTKPTGNACRVADPEPPLNVRTTPNGSIVTSLTNGTLVTILDYSANKSWVFIGRAEDRSPIGWVFAEYLDCRLPSLKTGKTANYSCYLARQFPESTKQDKDGIVETDISVIYTGDRFSEMEVQHRLESGQTRRRSDQYRDYKIFGTIEDDGASWKWTGTLAANRSLTMKGELSFAAGDDNFQYTEQLTANGKLDWVGVWSCRQSHPPN